MSGRKSDLEKKLLPVEERNIDTVNLSEKKRLTDDERQFIIRSMQRCNVCKSDHREVVNEFIRKKKFSARAISQWVQSQGALISEKSILNHIDKGHLNWQLGGVSRQNLTLWKRREAEQLMSEEDKKRSMEKAKNRLVKRVVNNVGTGKDFFEAKKVVRKMIDKLTQRIDILSENEKLQLSTNPKALAKANPELTKTYKAVIDACATYNKMEGEFAQSSLHNEGVMLQSFLKIAMKFPKNIRLQVINNLGFNPMQNMDSRDDIFYEDRSAKHATPEESGPIVDIEPDGIDQAEESAETNKPDE